MLESIILLSEMLWKLFYNQTLKYLFLTLLCDRSHRDQAL